MNNPEIGPKTLAKISNDELRLQLSDCGEHGWFANLSDEDENNLLPHAVYGADARSAMEELEKRLP